MKPGSAILEFSGIFGDMWGIFGSKCGISGAIEFIYFFHYFHVFERFGFVSGGGYCMPILFLYSGGMFFLDAHCSSLSVFCSNLHGHVIL